MTGTRPATLVWAERGAAVIAGLGLAGGWIWAFEARSVPGLVAEATAGLVVGRVLAGRRIVVLVATVAGLLAVVPFGELHAPSPPAEAILDAPAWAGLAAVVGVTALGLLIGGHGIPSPWTTTLSTFLFDDMSVVVRPVRGARAGEARVDPAVAAHPLGAGGWLVAAIALAGTLAMAVSLSTLAAVPDRSSFDLPLPPGWHVVSRQVPDWDWDPQLGRDLTATRGTAEVPPDPTVARLGLTVLRASAGPTPVDCYGSMDTWGRAPTALYDGAPLDRSDIDLPVGRAYREVRDAGSGTRVYGYAIVRSRPVGIVTEPLCYVLAITVPPEAGIGATDADAIARALRFR